MKRRPENKKMQQNCYPCIQDAWRPWDVDEGDSFQVRVVVYRIGRHVHPI
jgi:hypothetical protein